jgi:hypothetical protein
MNMSVLLGAQLRELSQVFRLSRLFNENRNEPGEVNKVN